MPKTVNNLFDRVVSVENLMEAFFAAAAHKHRKPEVLAETARAEATVLALHEELVAGTWTPGAYREFVCRSEVKRRLISAPLFRDRVVHHAVCRVVWPYFERKFIFDSYAVTPGKGPVRAVNRVLEFVRRLGPEAYVLQCDVAKYFPSIDHRVLLSLIADTVRDERLLALWWRLLESFNSDPARPGTGLPVGAYTSQLSANVYLNPLDHFVKEVLRVPCYVRYMDDFVLVHPDKGRLREWLARVEEFLSAGLRLGLNPKTRVFRASQGVDFAGYRVFPRGIVHRKRNLVAARRRFKRLSYAYARNEATFEDVTRRVTSFEGYARHCVNREALEATVFRHLRLVQGPKGPRRHFDSELDGAWHRLRPGEVVGDGVLRC